MYMQCKVKGMATSLMWCSTNIAFKDTSSTAWSRIDLRMFEAQGERESAWTCLLSCQARQHAMDPFFCIQSFCLLSCHKLSHGLNKVLPSRSSSHQSNPSNVQNISQPPATHQKGCDNEAKIIPCRVILKKRKKKSE